MNVTDTRIQKKWYSDAYRRNLVDMHIDDWSEEFLSRFSVADYVEALKIAHIQSPMIYLQSHVGHCYFPTKVGHMHAALRGREGLIKELVDACRAEGMKVVGYYSLIFNTYEEDRHPEWRLLGENDRNGYPCSGRDNGGRYGHLCPNSPGYRDFVAAQIKEMADFFTVDAMFYDMTFWPGGHPCRCPACAARYEKETGKKVIPNVDWSDPAWLMFQKKREEWMGEFAGFVTRKTKEFMPGVTVEHNYANAVAGSQMCSSTEAVNEWCDFTGGDLYGDNFAHSFTAKYYLGVTKNPPFEYMTCRCDSTLRVHTITKDEAVLTDQILLTAAHHGASLVIDAIDPVGTLDPRVYRRLGRVFEKQMPYEKYFSGKLKEDIGLYYSTSGRYNGRGEAYDSKTSSVNLSKTFVEANIPFGVVSNAKTDGLSAYRAVFAPAIAGISARNRADLYEYVAGGGVLYFSGAEDRALLHELLGADIVGYTDETEVYMAPTAAGEALFGEFNEKYPLPIASSVPKAVVPDAEVLAVLKLPYTKPGEKRFASIHTNPPGVLTDIPALVSKRVGKGAVIWSACPIEYDEHMSHRRFMISLLFRYVDKDSLSVISEAPRQVETVSFDTDEGVLTSVVDLKCTDEMLPIPGFRISVKCATAPTSVTRLAGHDLKTGEPKGDLNVPFVYDRQSGRVTFGTEVLTMFDMYRIK